MNTQWSDNIEEIRRQITASPRLLVACDFDGTLAPIASHPDDAVLSAETGSALSELAQAPGVSLAVVSGRSLHDLMMRVPTDGAYFAGSHGLELQGPGLKSRPVAAADVRDQLRSIGGALEAATAAFAGIIIEYRSLGLALHYRNATNMDAQAAGDQLRRLAGTASGFRLQSGHGLLELLPDVEYDKSTALLRILLHLGLPPSAACYFGDDAADEDAFCILPDAVTVRLGHVNTAARYVAKDPADLLSLLRRITQWRRGVLAFEEGAGASN